MDIFRNKEDQIQAQSNVHTGNAESSESLELNLLLKPAASLSKKPVQYPTGIHNPQDLSTAPVKSILYNFRKEGSPWRYQCYDAGFVERALKKKKLFGRSKQEVARRQVIRTFENY